MLKRIYPKAIWNFSRQQAVIYLTFDDGPVEGLTEWVLDELQKYKAKATFFCVGANVLKNDAIFQRIKNEGHQVGNHTMSHIKGSKVSVKTYLDEAHECKKLAANNLFRPPYGQMKRAQYKALLSQGFKLVLWDVISYDYEKISTAACAENVLKHTRNGSIVLFHDNVKAEVNLKHALPLFLKEFSDKGFRFEKIT